MAEYHSRLSIVTKRYVSPHCFDFILKVRQALRLVLHTISTSASRYGRYIEPVLSLSIDFYVRLFIRIHSAPIEVKKAARQVDFLLDSEYTGLNPQ